MNNAIVCGHRQFAKFSSQQLAWLHLIGEKFGEIFKELLGIFVPWWVIWQWYELFKHILPVNLQGKMLIVFLIRG